MFSRRGLLIIAAILSFLIVLAYVRPDNLSQRASWQHLSHGISQKIGLGEWTHKYNETELRLLHQKPAFKPGQPKPPGSNYTKLLISPRMTDENIDWMDDLIPDIPKAIYVANDPQAPLHPPVNKGHEVMIYLTYIIDHFDDLPDVMMFMHNHRYAWHNADLFGSDASEMITRLSAERVMREGFMNMRCHWYPGCPDWMHPGETRFEEQRPEEILIAHAWAELFPLDPVPDVLAQPCCAQFALSRDRVRTIPLAKFQYYRNWLLNTPLQDNLSGRVWEYVWQYVFTGESYWCPMEDVCYCDGFGVCFEDGIKGYEKWFELRGQNNDLNDKLRAWEAKSKAIEKALEEGRRPDEINKLPIPTEGEDTILRNKMHEISKEMNELVAKAKQNGENPAVRARVAGRPWKEGDGF